jgi:hypothetical protein
MKDILTKLKPIQWIPPSQTLEEFYFGVCPTPVITSKRFKYLKSIDSPYVDIYSDYDTYATAVSQHDSIHYLTGYGFDRYDESKIAHIEASFNLSDYPITKGNLDYYRNRIKFQIPKGLGRKVILEAAENLRDLY